MSLELWDPGRQRKGGPQSLKASEPASRLNILQSFKFVGARTRTQFVFEIDKERMLLSPKDWLLMTPKGWIKLTTPKEIDDYVDRKLVGPLFVFDAVERKEDRLVLKGTLFNASRTDMQPVDIVLQQTAACSELPSKRRRKGAHESGNRQMHPNNRRIQPQQIEEDDDYDLLMMTMRIMIR